MMPRQPYLVYFTFISMMKMKMKMMVVVPVRSR